MRSKVLKSELIVNSLIRAEICGHKEKHDETTREELKSPFIQYL